MPSQPVDTLTPIKDLRWSPLPGFPGVQVLQLSGELDEVRRVGRRTRLVRFEPGAETSEPLVHDYHEEAFLVSGDVQGFAEASAFGTFEEHAYVYRPPETRHGPIRSRGGCILFEIHYYGE